MIRALELVCAFAGGMIFAAGAIVAGAVVKFRRMRRQLRRPLVRA